MDNQIFGMNTTFISSSEAKNAYFMKYSFSCFMRCNKSLKWHIHEKNLNFLFIIYNFKCDRFFALYDIIQDCTLRHIRDDVA